MEAAADGSRKNRHRGDTDDLNGYAAIHKP